MVPALFIAIFFAACTMNTPLESAEASAAANAVALHGGQQANPQNVVANTSGVPLGSAATFAVLGGTTVTSVGPTVITGDLGVSPGTAITGFQPAPANTISGPGTVTPGDGVVTGTIYASGPVAAQAHNDAVIAYNYLVSQVPDADKIYAGVTQLDGMTLTPGVYSFEPSANLQVNGTLTLDFQGNADAVFIIKLGTTLVTMSGSNVVAINNPNTTCDGANVFWAVGSSATIDGDQFLGSVIAYTTITMAATAVVEGETNVSGRIIALGGAVTMASAKTIAVCDSTGTAPGGGDGTGNGNGDNNGKGSKGHKVSGDRVTGGGWFYDGSSKGSKGKGSRGHKRNRETFAISGGIVNGDFWGNLSYDDHQKHGLKIKSSEITGYFIIDAMTRRIEGTLKGKGSKGSKGSMDAGTFTVIVMDNGEGNKHHNSGDTLNLELFDASGASYYMTSGILDGGNIQIHTDWGI
jgi:hypothetical protein